MLEVKRDKRGSSRETKGANGASQENDLSIANFRCTTTNRNGNGRKRSAELNNIAQPTDAVLSKRGKSDLNTQKQASGSPGSREGCSRGTRKGSSLKSFWQKNGDLNMEELDVVVENAKNNIAEIPPDIYKDLIARGLIPCTLAEVLKERNKEWAKKQQLDASAREEQQRLLKAYQEQCSGWGNNREGWIHGKWNNVIVCPDFKKSCLQVSRSAMRDLWVNLVAVVNGFVDPNLVVCRVDDPTHPVRFATPPEESCYTVVYVGEPIRGSKDRRPLGEYTGVVREGKAHKQRFEYVFDLSFCASAWRAAEEFECDSDSSDDEQSSGLSPSPAGSSSAETAPKADGRAGGEEVKGTKRCVQVTRARGLSGVLKRVELPARGEFVLDSHEAFNQMSLVNHYGEGASEEESSLQFECVVVAASRIQLRLERRLLRPLGTIGLLGDRICHMNTEWQQVFVDGWPHIVLTTIPNVDINPGDEILADFGWSWFNKVQDASHEAISRELLEYRLGKRSGPNQRLAPARPEQCLNRRKDPALQCRARVGEICPYCQSDEHRQRGSEQSPWGERVVHCDGCDRPCHLRCIFGAHGVAGFDSARNNKACLEGGATFKAAAGASRPSSPSDLSCETREPPAEPPEARSDDTQSEEGEDASAANQEGDSQSLRAAMEAPSAAPCLDPRGSTQSEERDTEDRGRSAEEAEETESFEDDENYRWFTDFDYKWYCCVCRLQWERMARAMNFTVDWDSMQVLREGNPLIPPSAEQREARESELRRAPSPKEGGRGLEGKPLPRYSASVVVLESSGDERPLQKKRRGRRANSKGSQKMQTPSVERRLRRRTLPTASAALSGDEVLQGENPVSTDVPPKTETPSSKVTVNLAAKEHALQDAGESQDGTSDEKRGVGDCTDEGASTTVLPSPSSPLKSGDDPQQTSSSECCHAGGLRNRETSGPVVVEKVRVYATPSEKEVVTNMQPSPAAIIPQEMTKEELLGCKTNVINERRGLLGSLQPCLKCYRLLGARASVEVCRLTKRHLQPNWDHPHFITPAQIQDALLTCFQDGLLAVQSEYRAKLKEWYAGMPAHMREQRVQQLLRGDRQERILEDAGSRNSQDARVGIADRRITKGYVPIFGVRVGKTEIRTRFKAGWFTGRVTEYSPAPIEDGTVYTNQFKVDYEDGDSETLTPEGFHARLMKGEIIVLTPVSQLLDPMMVQGKRLSSMKFKSLKKSLK